MTLPAGIEDIIIEYCYTHLWQQNHLSVEVEPDFVLNNWEEFEEFVGSTYNSVLVHWSWMCSHKLAQKYNIENVLEYIEDIRKNDRDPNYDGQPDPTEGEKKTDRNMFLYYKTQNYMIIILQDIWPYETRVYKVYVNVEDEEDIRYFINYMVKQYVKEYGAEI